MTTATNRPSAGTQAASTPAEWTFPEGFEWGAATAAYQIEGAVGEGGRGPSIWDTFSHTAGKVVGGDTGDVAVDHYHRYRSDVALMAELGLKTYRYSVAWPRIQPTGSGPANPAGLAFYDRLTDTLLEHGIKPALTLYHWDLPQVLEDAGGWTSRDTAYRFADYALLVQGALGDRIGMFTTLNEPWCSAYLGYASGIHAPGRTDPVEGLTAMHHLLLGHGLATRAMRERETPGQQFSITLNLAPVWGATDSPEDLEAVRRVDGLQNRIFLDPLLRARYPQDVLEDLHGVSDFSFVLEGDEATIGAPIDVLGINYYTPSRVRADPDSPGLDVYPGSAGVGFLEPQGDLSAMGWEIAPSGLEELLTRLQRDYDIPMMVTENGAAFDDVLAADGRVHDARRLQYLEGHFKAAHSAINQGVDLRGYLVWSLLDNFEWAEGYAKRFGIVYVDYDSQSRYLKDSARWYGGVIRANGV